MASGDEGSVIGLLQAFNERRFEDFAAAYAPDAVVEYPQSGERIAGREMILGMVKAFPAPPRFEVTRVRAAEDLVVVEADADYGEGGTWKAVLVYTMAAGLVAAETAWFGAPFDPAEWRAPFRAM